MFLFFEARGYTWALLQSLEALEVDFAPVLQDKNAIVSVKQIVRELENTQNIILPGDHERHVLSVDIYAEPPHARRGGWTWYTGAAGWFYRAGLESILGLTVRDGRMHFAPCIASAWRHYVLTYRHGAGRYGIRVENPKGVEQGVVRIELDGESQPLGVGIQLVDDGQVHRVRVELGPIDPVQGPGSPAPQA